MTSLWKILKCPYDYCSLEREMDNGHRGLIYTEHNPICRLCTMCNLFFYEFRVIPSANVFQLVCYSATICTTNSKSEPKKFSILCTYKQQRTLTSSGWPPVQDLFLLQISADLIWLDDPLKVLIPHLCVCTLTIYNCFLGLPPFHSFKENFVSLILSPVGYFSATYSISFNISSKTSLPNTHPKAFTCYLN
jgi:hypothetical protein